MVSIFQLRPSLIRCRFLSIGIHVKEYCKEEYDGLNAEIKKYQIVILGHYGVQDCQSAPTKIDHRKLRERIDKYLSKNKMFHINFHGKRVACKFISKTKHKLMVELSGIGTRYITYSKLWA